MSDENLNNSNEETAALFVSAQKKKKAEEEAKRKAAEEQARRDAAEAEVRKMEQEVEDRKRKAEEERKALEEAEKAPKPARSAAPAAGSKTPMFIGIGIAAVVVIVLIAVFAGKGGKGGAATQIEENLEFKGEYTPKHSGSDIKLSYPDTLFTKVSEEDTTGIEGVIVKFRQEDENALNMDCLVIDYKLDDGSDLVRGKAGCTAANDVQKIFMEKVRKNLDTYLKGAEISDEEGEDVKADNPGRYKYKCSFSSEDYGKGNCEAWLEANSEGVFKSVIVVCAEKSDNTDNTSKICNLFADNNADDAFSIPGAMPPKSTDGDAVLEVDEIHMGLHVPKDTFFEFKGAFKESMSHLWTDDNGAMIIVNPRTPDITMEEAIENVDLVQNYFKEQAQTGINQYITAVESRNLLDEKTGTEGMTYTANYRDVLGGVVYWERYYADFWRDERTGDDYAVMIVTLAPEKNKDVYQEIFDKTLSRLEDI